MAVVTIPTHGRVLREYNPCHEPEGQPVGGQFAPKGSCAAGGETFRLFAEEPGSKKLIKKQAAADPVRSFSNDLDWEVDDILGERFDIEEVARGMVGEVTSEQFDVTVSEAEDEDGGSNPDLPDPDDRDTKDRYQRWLEDEYGQAEERGHTSERKDYLQQAERSVSKIDPVYRQVVAEMAAKGEISLTSGPVAQSAAHEQAYSDLYDASLALLGKERIAGGVLDDDGFLAQGDALKDRIEQMVRSAVERGVTSLPDEFHGGWDEDDLLSRSRYFNEDDGWSNWLDDSRGESYTQDLDSFDTWYERTFGAPPSDYGAGGASPIGLMITFLGNRGTKIKRTFSQDGSGGIHVHHNYFSVGTDNAKGEGLGKEVLSGSFKQYQRIGVSEVTTLANIDVGSYAWARYGFLPEEGSERVVAGLIEHRVQQLHSHGFLTAEEARAVADVVDPHSPRTVWAVADARLYVGLDRARELARMVQEEARTVQEKAPHFSTSYVKLVQADAERGIINVGRLAMVGMDSWRASLRLDDGEQMRRLWAYLGIG